MSTLLKALGLLSYDKYMEKFEDWVKTVKTSSLNPTTAYIEYTKLNFARTQRIHKTVVINAALRDAALQLHNKYTLIVITEAWCGDSAQNLPVIAELAKLNPEKISLHIILRDENPEMMNNYLTNGARAIPKLICINETMGSDAFVWGPRPAPAQALLANWKQNPNGKTWEDFERELHGWYGKDKTVTLQAELLTILQNLM
ncbi:MAG: thioredoxin family protein [Bacteroidetes bacterium]|nr:thioredoxin family protein [Bacteroidota bacterium]